VWGGREENFAASHFISVRRGKLGTSRFRHQSKESVVLFAGHRILTSPPLHYII
jgi:hypothetical protein